MKKDAQARLLETATSLFARKGFAAVSVRELAQAADVRSALITSHNAIGPVSPSTDNHSYISCNHKQMAGSLPILQERISVESSLGSPCCA